MIARRRFAPRSARTTRAFGRSRRPTIRRIYSASTRTSLRLEVRRHDLCKARLPRRGAGLNHVANSGLAGTSLSSSCDNGRIARAQSVDGCVDTKHSSVRTWTQHASKRRSISWGSIPNSSRIETISLSSARIESRAVAVGAGAQRCLAGDHTRGRDARLLDPATEPARVRAMYTHPDFVRRGIGRLVLSLCEAAAAREGFRSLELVATVAGEPLYRACGFTIIERHRGAHVEGP